MSGMRAAAPLFLLGAALLSACGGGYSGDAADSRAEGGSGAPGDGAGSGNGGSGGSVGSGSNGSGSDGGGGNGTGTGFSDERSFFAARVQPSLDFCRSCHVPGGVADTDKGRRFQLSSDPSQDYDKTYASWTALGKGVETNRILLKASNTDPEPHSGGAPWPRDSVAYGNMKLLLACWNDPAGCAALLGEGNGGGGGVVEPQLPLLGNPGKHYFVNQLCDGAPDSTPIDWSQDPRRLMTEDSGNLNNDSYAVYFNEPFEICHTDTLLQNQARQNELRVAQGKKPVHTARPYAQTCGEWRQRVKVGQEWIATWPTDSPMQPHALQIAQDGAYGSGVAISGSGSEAWNNLWKVWGLSERPANFDRQVSERYGFAPTPAHLHNPYPLPGEDPATTNGGSGRLPLGYAQGRDADGKYNGQLGINCFVCHAAQLGEGEIASHDGSGDAASYGKNPTGSFMGLPNSMQDYGAMVLDLANAGNEGRTPTFGIPVNVNATRGTHTADTDIEFIFAIRDWDTLNFSRPFVEPLHGSYGDQDPPAWWWLHNKARYLWFGGLSTDSARGNMYFGSVNGLSGDQVKQNEAIFESVHDWSLSLEAPDYPGAIDTPLAEQGAILFHEKDLWAGDGNADIPRPKGNGSCAGCHGAYSPRYANRPGFLPDPRLIGSTSYSVPTAIIQTDPAQTEGWAKMVRHQVNTMWHSYADGVEDYRMPETKDPLTEFLDEYAILDGVSGSNVTDFLERQLRGLGVLAPLHDVVATVTGTALTPVPGIPLGEALGRVQGACGFPKADIGYVTPPLHGVWASAPYFHNGSVPTVWQVLKPADRPKVWRRQRTTNTDVDFNGFEYRLQGSSSGYDHGRLGWKHEVLACDDGGQGIPYYQCQPAQALPTEVVWVQDTLTGKLLWPTYGQLPWVGEEGLATRMIFNTNLHSKKNAGHEWTQVLTDPERRALIEYLKTL